MMCIIPSNDEESLHQNDEKNNCRRNEPQSNTRIDIDHGENVIIQKGPNICRCKKTAMVLSIVLVITVVVAVSFSLKSKKKESRQITSNTSAASEPFLPWSDNYKESIPAHVPTGKPTGKPTDLPSISKDVPLTLMTEPPTNISVLSPNSQPSSRPSIKPTSTPTISPAVPFKTPPPTVNFTPSPTSKPSTKATLSPTKLPTILSKTSDPISFDDVCLDIEFRSDQLGQETGWTFSSVPEDGSPPLVIVSVPKNTYGNYTKDVRRVCVAEGKYSLSVYDLYGGMCCATGEGYYSIKIDGREILRGGFFQTSSISHDILVGYDPDISDREKQWLDGHNKRREAFHLSEGMTFRELVWSPELAKSAAKWINQLLPTCLKTRAHQEPGIEFGENIYQVSKSVSQIRTPEDVLGRWVDAKIASGKGYPQNIEMTQVLWRATGYVGCAEMATESSEGFCNIFVCRYARAGNCGMASYNANEGDNWKIPVLMNYTKCGPDCAPEGCH